MALKFRKRYKQHSLSDLRKREHLNLIRLTDFRFWPPKRIVIARELEQKNKLL